MKKRVYYYHDPLHDDFAQTNIKREKIPEDYQFLNTHWLYKIGEGILHVVIHPIVTLMLKIPYLFRVKNRKAFRKVKNQGFFLYGNHTGYLLDAYMPSIITFPKMTHIIVNADAVSIPGLRTLVKMLGAIPIPSSVNGFRNYRKAIRELIERKRAIAIYPEAHIWPFYTDIRPFGTQSFHYPVDCGVPCFTYTNVYRRRKCKWIRFPKVVTYIDGPFYPDESLPRPERVQKLRDQVYGAMKARVDGEPKYNYAEYIYVENNQ